MNEDQISTAVEDLVSQVGSEVRREVQPYRDLIRDVKQVNDRLYDSEATIRREIGMLDDILVYVRNKLKHKSGVM